VSIRNYLQLLAGMIMCFLFLHWLEQPTPARSYCPPPPQAELVQMRGTGYCPRVPTVPKPYCPLPP